MIWTFLAASSLASVFSKGISRRHGAHQVAQKLIISDFPAQRLTGVDLPERSFNANSGMRSGILGATNSSTDRSLGLGGLAEPAGTFCVAATPVALGLK